MGKSIEQDALQVLLQAHAIREARVSRQGSAWALSVRLGATWHTIRSRREPIRTWSSLTAIGRFCEKVGIRSMTVEL